MPSVKPEQLENIHEILGPKSTILASAVIRLLCFNSTDERWQHTGLSGALCFVIDRS